MWLENEKLNIEITGNPDGPAILFVHGAGGESGLWRLVAERLAPGFRAAAIDLSGHGASPRKGEHTLDTYVSDVLAAARALGGGEPPVLCGHSMGGAVVMQAALQAPDAVRSIILTNTGARLRVFPAIFGQLRADYPAAVKMMPQFAFAPGAPREIIAYYEERMLELDPEVVIQDFTICDGFDVMARLGKIRAKTLVVSSEKDQLTPAKYSNFLRDGIPGAELLLMPGRGHMSMLEAPGEFAAVCGTFMRQAFSL